MTYIDLSHEFIDNMPVFPGDPKTTLKQVASISANGYTDHQLSSVMHVGTHVDAPLHMIDGGKYVSELSVESFAGNGILIDVRGRSLIDVDSLKNTQISQGDIVLLYTGMSEVFGTEKYDMQHPELSEEFARLMVQKHVRMVGMDMINPDNKETFPIHKILLGNGILIIENLTNLKSLLTANSFDVFAFPLKLHTDAAWARVVAKI